MIIFIISWPVADLSGSDVVAVAVDAAASSTLQLTVVDLHTHSAVTCPTLDAHTRHVTGTHKHTLGLQGGGGRRGGGGGGCVI